MDDSDYNLRDIKLTLKITKIVSIDKTFNMLEIKKICKDLFSKYNFNSEYIYHVGENEVTNLDKINVLKTLNFYKTNEIFLKINSNQTMETNEKNIYLELIRDEFQSAKEKFDSKFEIPVSDNKNYISKLNNHRSKECVTDAYSNLELIRKKIGEIKNTQEDYQNANELINKSEQIIANSYDFLKNHNNQNLNSHIERNDNILTTNNNNSEYLNTNNYSSNKNEKYSTNSHKKSKSEFNKEENYNKNNNSNYDQNLNNYNNYNNYNQFPFNNNNRNDVNENSNFITPSSNQGNKFPEVIQSNFDTPIRIIPIKKGKL